MFWGKEQVGGFGRFGTVLILDVYVVNKLHYAIYFTGSIHE